MATNKQLKRWTQPLDLWLLDSIIVLLPTYLLRFHFGSFSFNALDIIIMTAFILCVIYHRGVQIERFWQWSMLIFLFLAALAVWVAPDKQVALGLFKSYCVMPVLVGVMILTIRPPLSHLTKVVGLLVTYLSLIALGQYLTGFGIPAPWNEIANDYRATSIFDYPNAVGLILAPLVIWLITAYIHRLERSWWIWLVSGLGLAAIILSRSDGAIVAIIMSLVFTSIYTRYRWSVLAGLGLLVIVALIIPETRTIILFQDASGEVRLALWQGTLNLLWHHPWFGAGLGGFPELYAEYKLARHVELLVYPHNIFLDFWVEFGLLGLGWFIVMLVQFFRRLAHYAKPTAIILMSVMFGILVYGLVDVPYFKNDLAVIFWMILTLSTVILPVSFGKK